SQKSYLIVSVLVICVITSSLIPFFPTYSVPHIDYFKVMTIINYLQEPGLYSGDRLTQISTNFHSQAAPIYFYGLAYPLNFLISSKWVMLILGSVITVLCVFFSGENWRTKENLLTAVLMTIVLVNLRITPLEGHMRSFTAFFVLWALWLGDDPDFLVLLFLTGLAAGIYPPAGLLILAYFGLQELKLLATGDRRPTLTIARLGGAAVIFNLVLLPYWFESVLSSELSSSQSLIPGLKYNLNSFVGFFESFVHGSRGAFFLSSRNYNSFVNVGILCLFQALSLRKSFTLRPTFRKLLIASLGAWTLAHLLHPLIYLPFKYTRTTLILFVVLVFLDNLKPMVDWLNQLPDVWSRRLSSTNLIHPIGFMILASLFLFLFPDYASGLKHKVLQVILNWNKLLIAVSAGLAAALFLPEKNNLLPLKSLGAGGAICIILFFQLHTPPSILGLTHGDFQGLYQYVRTTPPGTTVAAPPVFYSDPISAFGKRPTYTSRNHAFQQDVCDRNTKFWNIYYSDSPEEIAEFMRRKNIDYILVDRRMVEIRTPLRISQCEGIVKPAKTPYLNRHFGENAWAKGNRMYLLGPEHIHSNQTDA
ncbi:MAG: hypothetical protein ABEK50_08475, partial [bacterium]